MTRPFIYRMRALLLLGVFASLTLAAQPSLKTRNVIFVMTDGLRWQELFQGADAALLNEEDGRVSNLKDFKPLYWRDTPAGRREVLMPFFWQVVAKNGQVYGNRTLGSDAGTRESSPARPQANGSRRHA